MPCYVVRDKPPSRKEYDQWYAMGYRRSWDDYCAARKAEEGGTMIITGDLGPHCFQCAGVGDFLCDYPVGEGQTCDRPMCDDHAHELAPELHYCDAHYKMWTEFKASGGVDAALANVIAFKTEK